MDLTSFFIFIAPVLVLAAALVIVFLWGAKAKPPAFVTEDQNKSKKDGAS
ncbi:cytochrome bd oxidase small subunit CydS [Evansella halocellulosilytica]|nr:hypothetical protein [Evansella halocellulosilytica]